jgi:hypothetical protein
MWSCWFVVETTAAVVVVDAVIEGCIGVTVEWFSSSTSNAVKVFVVVVDVMMMMMMMVLIMMWVCFAMMAYLLYYTATLSRTCLSHYHVASEIDQKIRGDFVQRVARVALSRCAD